MRLWSRECPVCADIGWCNDHPIKDHDDMTTKPNEPEGLCALCGHARHRHGSGYPATCPIIPTYRAPTQPVADAGGVTVDLVREWLMSTDHPVSQWEREFAAAIDAHRLQSVAAATAAKDAEIDNIRETLLDTVAVHMNMLRGSIARPSARSIIHVYGEEVIRAAISEARNAE